MDLIPADRRQCAHHACTSTLRQVVFFSITSISLHAQRQKKHSEHISMSEFLPGSADYYLFFLTLPRIYQSTVISVVKMVARDLFLHIYHQLTTSMTLPTRSLAVRICSSERHTSLSVDTLDFWNRRGCRRDRIIDMSLVLVLIASTSIDAHINSK